MDETRTIETTVNHCGYMHYMATDSMTIKTVTHCDKLDEIKIV